MKRKAHSSPSAPAPKKAKASASSSPSSMKKPAFKKSTPVSKKPAGGGGLIDRASTSLELILDRLSGLKKGSYANPKCYGAKNKELTLDHRVNDKDIATVAS